MITPFGSGVMFGKQRSTSGVTTTNPTPRRFAMMQDIQVDIKGDNKKLRGQNQVAVRGRRGTLDISAKSKIGSLDPNMLNDLFLGCPSASGIVLIADSEAHVVGTSTATARANSFNYTLGMLYSSGGYVYQCVTAGESAAALPALETVLGSENADGAAVFVCVCAVASSIATTNAEGFVEDFGLYYGNGSPSAGAPLVCSGIAAPLQGQYQVSFGYYIFNVADAGQPVLISYTYKVANRGTTVTLTNQMQGAAPEFECFVYNVDENNKYVGLYLSKCRGTDMSIPSKQGDYWMSSFDFDALADDITGNWGALYADNF